MFTENANKILRLNQINKKAFYIVLKSEAELEVIFLEVKKMNLVA